LALSPRRALAEQALDLVLEQTLVRATVPAQDPPLVQSPLTQTLASTPVPRR
jgi:hypothetical protein